LANHFPSTTFAFLPADIVTQTLNFGLPSPIDVQVSGINTDANREIANDLLQKMRDVPGAVDLRVQQAYDYPTLNVDVDRTKARQFGLTQQNVASNVLVSLSGSFQTTPSYWTDPKTGTSTMWPRRARNHNCSPSIPWPLLRLPTAAVATPNCSQIWPPSVAAPAPRW